MWFECSLSSVVLIQVIASQHLSVWFGHIPVHRLQKYEYVLAIYFYDIVTNLVPEFNDRAWIKYYL